MSDFHAITADRHASKRWQRYSSYAFAAHEAMTPLVASELTKAVLHLPIGFVEQGEGFVPVAIFGFEAGKNLYVAPDGRWLAKYAPAALRSYPFRLLQAEDGKQVLCIDESSGQITDGPEGERFFDEEGKPSQALLDILGLLEQIEGSRKQTVAACASLKKHNLIQPWPITVKNENGDQQISGLFRVDESALNHLSAEALHEISQAGALPIAYCQMLSMQHLSYLGELAVAHAQVAAKALETAAEKTLNANILSQTGETLNFSALR